MFRKTSGSKFPITTTGSTKLTALLYLTPCYRFASLLRLSGISLLLILLIAASAAAQQRKELEDRRRELIKNIRETTGMLNETRKDKEAAMDRMYVLQNQVHNREQLINTLHQEIDYTSDNINRSTEVVSALNTDIDRLKKEYSLMIRKAYRLRMNNSPLLYILSADNFSQAFRRWQYLRQYDRYRKKQALLIAETQQTLTAKIQVLEKRKSEKENLLATVEVQKKMMANEAKEKSQLVKSLKNNEKQLQKELKQQELQHQQLDEAIERVILAEIKASREKARSLGAKPKPSGPTTAKTPPALEVTDTPENIALSNDFRKNRGSLPWPVAKGVVTRRFGRQPHPTLPKVEITNNGIDIRTDPNAEVKSIFNGKVSGIQFIPGFNNILIIQHGNYYSVYSNLDEVYVKKGDVIKTKQAIGKVGLNNMNGKPELHFEIWKEKEHLDPAIWVLRN